MRGAALEAATLENADLRGARLGGAVLNQTNLRGADLRGAYLRVTRLRRADLSGADLRGAVGLTLQQIDEALYDHNARLPEELGEASSGGE